VVVAVDHKKRRIADNMITDPDLFSSDEHLREAFETGLKELLHRHDELGVFILVLANAVFDQNIFDHLAPVLEAKFDLLAKEIGECLVSAEGCDPSIPDDDLEVFRRLMLMGFENIHPPQYRQVGPWEVQFNQLRSFRPARISNTEINGITLPFDPQAFHFNKSFLSKEILWVGDLAGRDSTLFYNKYPFVPLHGLLVPECELGRPQLLDRSWLEYLWDITEQLGAAVPGIGFAYNSYGANASVNHLHFQMSVREDPLPIAADIWEHNGGDLPYPVDCHRFTSLSDAWEFLQGLHQQESNYNLLALPGVLFSVPRNRQGSYSHSGWTEGFAWYELCGGATTFDKESFEQLTALDVSREMELLKLEG
jgi:diadenosine tetraphosphate (Ap4A) HIT family hydrolase